MITFLLSRSDEFCEILPTDGDVVCFLTPDKFQVHPPDFSSFLSDAFRMGRPRFESNGLRAAISRFVRLVRTERAEKLLFISCVRKFSEYISLLHGFLFAYLICTLHFSPRYPRIYPYADGSSWAPLQLNPAGKFPRTG